ncbi:hypothetical protein F5878DRAFT_630456 [Lentinula raphanica]|uniref:Uncharacterized protein n=1 Tax=Lentinula raphanica TaxID=153919 RepID=A0AA38P1K7_9AGAR|nr:hypothetical protein C8R42DRAFT_778435 [Lentinula raphanica]KAJ3818753.1 hypothetical protein F5880DRAFT_1598179 [Lentinula raphanica]KAJ3834456.1 hypothetical protein F5878DRAFT_630456 [Lentinula raphanica]
MSFFVKLAISLFSLQVLITQALPSAEPRTDDITICGFEGNAPFCPKGDVCCGPLLEINGTTYGSSCVPKNGPCPL